MSNLLFATLLTTISIIFVSGIPSVGSGPEPNHNLLLPHQPNEYPLPRATLPDGFGAKMAYQTVTRTRPDGGKVVSERLVRCGIETDADGVELFPCNPSFDTRPYIKGLDHVGTGYNSLTGGRTAPLFEWSVPPWFKPSYDSGVYNYPNKIPEQIVLTSVASGEGGMVTELFESYDQFQSKQSFSIGVSFGAFGANNALSLSKSSERFRSAFDNYQVGVSKQQYKLYQLEVKPEIFGYCPYVDPIFTAEKMDLEDKSAARPPASDGKVATWDAAAVGKWLESISLSKISKEFVANGVTGPLLLTLSDSELSELGLTRDFDKHKLKFELELARHEVLDADKSKFMDVGTNNINPWEDAPSAVGTFKEEGEEEDDSKKTKKTQKDLDAEDEDNSGYETADSDAGYDTANEGEDPETSKKKKAVELTTSSSLLEQQQQRRHGSLRRTNLRQNRGHTLQDVISGKVKVGMKENPQPEIKSTKSATHPRFVRKWILRQAFMDAVNALPILTSSEISKICSDYEEEDDHTAGESDDEMEEDDGYDGDDDVEKEPKEKDGDPHRDEADDEALLEMKGDDDSSGVNLKQAENAYRRFLHDWGTHWTKSVIMGGEVAVTTMVRKSLTEEKQSDTTTKEANVEHALDAQEADSDAESTTESVVETNSGTSTTAPGSTNGDGNGATDDGESVSSSSTTPPLKVNVPGTPTKHQVVTGSRKDKGILSSTADVLSKLATAAASGLSGGVVPLIKAAIQNLELKLAVSASSSSSSSKKLTAENNKNEVKFVGGDTAIDPDARGIGGMSFDAWKDSIKSDPAPISKTMAPITELMVQFAGPNAGEQCEAKPSERYRRRQMTECMTRQVLKEGRALADTSYEIEQVEKRKAKLQSKIVLEMQSSGASTTNKALTQEWSALCKIRMTLLSKQDYQKINLNSFTFTTPIEDGHPSHNYGKVCDRELSALTHGGQTKMVTSVTRQDPRTGRVVQDTCAMCMAIYDNAKCLTTQNECGENSESIKITKFKELFIDALNRGKCTLNEEYDTCESDCKMTGAMPSDVHAWISTNQKLNKINWKGRNGWMGWSTILFAEKRHLCHKVTNKLVCEQFIDKLRREFCLPAAENTIVNRQRNRLIAALDFGVKGIPSDETSARDACECANFCSPVVTVPKEGLKSFIEDMGKGIVKTVIDAAFNKDYINEIYRETLVQQELMQCVVGKPLPRPILPASLSKSAEKQVWKNDEPNQCIAGFDYEESTTGIYVNQISYMGHCTDDFMCFESDYMNQGEPGRTLLETKPKSDPDTPTLSIFDLSGDSTRDDSNDFATQQMRKDRSAASGKEVTRFKAWGKSPTTREFWTHRGIVYAELLKSPSTGMPKIIVVQSGIAKDPHASAQIAKWFKTSLHLTGHNDKDPRRILEMEDRDGNDMCMVMYSLCCAIGGELKQDSLAMDYPSLKEMCPAGTVCCPLTKSTEDNTVESITKESSENVLQKADEETERLFKTGKITKEERDSILKSHSEAKKEIPNDVPVIKATEEDGKTKDTTDDTKEDTTNLLDLGSVKGNPVPWTPNTVRLLHVLSHGKMIGAPPMESNDPAQGWLSHDPISKSGPGVCVNVQAFKDVFQTEELMSDSRTVAKEKAGDAENPFVICRFVCQMHEKRKGFYKIKGKKEVPCTDKSGRMIDVRVGPIKRGHCTNTFDPRTSKMSLKAMEMCKKFTLKNFKQEGINKNCGVDVKLLNEMADKKENWEENMNDSLYLSANTDTE